MITQRKNALYLHFVVLRVIKIIGDIELVH